MADSAGIPFGSEQRTAAAAAAGEPVVKHVLKVSYFNKQFPH
jgi:hypothetical protein